MHNAGHKGKGMELTLPRLLASTIALLLLSTTVYSQSPYMGQESREIKALSPQEISDYLLGRGMGLAKAAELNGYPGPAHVLELAVQLEITSEQRPRPKCCLKKCRLGNPSRERVGPGRARTRPPLCVTHREF